MYREIDELSEDTAASPDPWSSPPVPIQIDSEVDICDGRLVCVCVCVYSAQYTIYDIQKFY